MKRCPTCDKTFDDQLRFCQSDGTPLVDDAPAFDPYATIIASRPPIAEPEPPEPLEMEPDSAGQSPDTGYSPIEPPAEELEMPPVDPLKTMYVSEAELKEVMASSEGHPGPGEAPVPEPPRFSEPEVPAPVFGDRSPTPPPSPFSAPADDDLSGPETFVRPAPMAPEERAPEAPPPTAFDAPPPPAFESSPAPPTFGQPAASYVEPQFGGTGGFQPAAQASDKNQTLAIISLITGLLSILFCGISGPIGVITGWMARKRAKSEPANFGGEGLALVGIITGALGTLLLLGLIAYIVFVFLFVGFASLR